MDVDRAREKRQHAEREAHDEAEEIKIRPGHTAPRAHSLCASWNRDADHSHCKLVGSLRWRMSAAARAGVWLLSWIDAGPQNLAREEFPPAATTRSANPALSRPPTVHRLAPDQPKTPRLLQRATNRS